MDIERTIYDTAGMVVDDEALSAWIPPTAAQYKTMRFIFSEWAKLNREVDRFPYVELTFNDCFNIIGLPADENVDKICQLLQNCEERCLLLPFKGEAMFVFPFDCIRINKETQVIRARPSLFMIEYITELGRNFAILPLEYISKLTSVEAIRLYELCKEMVSTENNQREFDNLPQLCRTLFLRTPVKDWNAFMEKYFLEYVEQINEKTDLIVRCEPERTEPDRQAKGITLSVAVKMR